ncbi:MAG: leucine-rich repeat domain-containing protein [Ruminococcus sp.]
MKKIIVFLLTIMTICFCFVGCGKPASSPVEDFVCEFENGSAVITDYIGKGLDIILPETIDNRPVTKISQQAFEGYDLNSIIFSNNIVEIQNQAFKDCTNLTSVTLPKEIQIIGERAFYNCTNLNCINLNDSILNIGSEAFALCKNLKQIKLPSKLIEINGATFSECSSLSEVTFPEELETIGFHAFEKCTSLENIDLPDTIKVIEDGAFSDCNNLNNIGGIDTTKVEIGKEAFINTKVEDKFAFSIDASGTLLSYSGKSDKIVVPDTVTAIGDNAFFSNDYIVSVTLSKNTKSIGYQAFFGCDKLSEVILPNGLTTIDYGAFNFCKSLKSIHIPESVKYIAPASIGTDLLDENYSDFVIYGKTGSASEKYANERGLKFISE